MPVVTDAQRVNSLSLDKNVTRKPAEPQPRDPWQHYADSRNNDISDDPCVRHCGSFANNH
jgi:hypothetical protein